MRISTNTFALTSLRLLGRTSKALNRALERLASGQRINRAGDDAVGLAVSSGLESQIKGASRVAKNINESFGILSTAEAGISTQIEITQRMRELALQAANGMMSSEARGYLNAEFDLLLEEFNRLARQTEYNGLNLLDGSFATVQLQVGSQKGEYLEFGIGATHSYDVFRETITVNEATEETTEGLGTFGAAVAVETHAGYAGFDLYAADMDGDSTLDLISNGTWIHLGNGDGTFQAGYTNWTVHGNSPSSFEVGDINGDNHADLIGWEYTGGGIYITLSNGDGTFQATTGIATSAGVNRVIITDLDGDGQKDLVSTNVFEDRYYTYLGNGDGTFGAGNHYTSTDRNFHISAADFNEDGRVDIIGLDDAATIYYAEGNGDGSLDAPTTMSGGQYGRITHGDLNKDGNLDIIATETFTDDVSVLFGNGDGTFDPATNFDMGDMALGAATGLSVVDLDGDENLDIVTSDHNDGNVSILLGNGDGTFESRRTVSMVSNVYGLVVFDVDGDEINDLVGISSTTSQIVKAIQNTHTVQATEEQTEEVAATLSILTQDQAQDALEILDTGLDYLNEQRADIGAYQSRFESAYSMTQINLENLSQARSQILDADFAEETAELVRHQILQQTGVSVLAQANLTSQLALRLLGAITR